MSGWDDDVKIGRNVHRGAGGPRETVVKGKSALNAAARSGAIIATEKKYAAGNAVCANSRPERNPRALTNTDNK